MCSIEKIVDVPGTNGNYQASSLGYIIGPSGKILKPRLEKAGYGSVVIGSVRPAYIHRLIAEIFIPNPLGLPQVNHKDEDKSNNAASNLEWCTGTYNQRYSRGKQVAQYKCGELIAVYNSHGEAAEKTGLSRSNISSCTIGRLHSCGGFTWKNIMED